MRGKIMFASAAIVSGSENACFTPCRAIATRQRPTRITQRIPSIQSAFRFSGSDTLTESILAAKIVMSLQTKHRFMPLSLQSMIALLCK